MDLIKWVVILSFFAGIILLVVLPPIGLVLIGFAVFMGLYYLGVSKFL